MKKVTSYLFIFTLFLASCSNNEAINNEKQALLKSYKVVKDAQGRYSIDYNVNSNVAAEVVKNNETNSNDIYLYRTNSADKASFSEALSLQNDLLKIGFVSDSEKIKSLVIEDENIVLAKGAKSTEFLKEYSIESIGNNEYKLDFEVKEGVNVSFTYNDEEGAYEVHLKEGKQSKAEFSKTYTKDSEILKIDFVNHIERTAMQKANTVEIEKIELPKRPRIGIQ